MFVLAPRMENPPRAILLENVVGFVAWFATGAGAYHVLLRRLSMLKDGS